LLLLPVLALLLAGLLEAALGLKARMISVSNDERRATVKTSAQAGMSAVKSITREDAASSTAGPSAARVDFVFMEGPFLIIIVV
jgi:hypothetical protein